jgi:hypothetical protein
MEPYFFEGKYTPTRFKQAMDNTNDYQNSIRLSIEKFDGKLFRCFYTAIGNGLIGFVEFPSFLHASAWNAYSQGQDSVLSFTITRLLDESELSQVGLMVKIKQV